MSHYKIGQTFTSETWTITALPGNSDVFPEDYRAVTDDGVPGLWHPDQLVNTSLGTEVIEHDLTSIIMALDLADLIETSQGINAVSPWLRRQALAALKDLV